MVGFRLGRQLGSLVEVFRNPLLARLQLAWAGHQVGEWGLFVVLSIWAFDHGGVAAVGVLGLVRMGAAAAALPFAGMVSDRYPRQRVLFGVYLGRAATLGALALTLAGSVSSGLVFVLVAVASAAQAPALPATVSLLPLLARTPSELVASNVTASVLEGLGTLLGPLLGGVLALSVGLGPAVAVAASVYVPCALVVAGIRREGEVGARPRTERRVLAELLRGGKALLEESRPRLIVLLFGAQTLVRGLLNVLIVIAAVDLLGLGRAGVGWLNASLGAGALLGGLVAAGLVGRRRLAAPFGLALVLWGAPIALVGVWPRAWWALVCMGAVGVANAVLDTSGLTLLQRTVDDHVLGRVFGVFEILVALAIALGSVLGSLLVTELDVRRALIVSGAFLPVLALLSRRALRRVDLSSAVPEPELAVVSSLPLFSPLPATTLERLAFRLLKVTAEAGTKVAAQGTPGELFYVVGSGEIDIVRDGRFVKTLRPGDYFGEVALLHDVPRTAACIAKTDVELYALNRESFVAAVGGDRRSSDTAEEVMTRRLDELSELARATRPSP